MTDKVPPYFFHLFAQKQVPPGICFCAAYQRMLRAFYRFRHNKVMIAAFAMQSILQPLLKICAEKCFTADVNVVFYFFPA